MARCILVHEGSAPFHVLSDMTQSCTSVCAWQSSARRAVARVMAASDRANTKAACGAVAALNCGASSLGGSADQADAPPRAMAPPRAGGTAAATTESIRPPDSWPP